jgi:predicted tellurium resistance membrane protein TerC
LTAYIGFFALLWLTWYQVSLYDVRFSADSVFERVAKAIHFGVMVGFAVIGVQWKPGQEIADYKIYKAFGLILMVSRITLFAQYSVTLFYTRRYTKTIVPLCIIMASTLLAALVSLSRIPPISSREYKMRRACEILVGLARGFMC